MKTNCPDTLVVMITSYASLELAVNATNKGAYDFVPKPFTPQELKTSMESITKHLFLKRMTKTLKKEGKQIRFQFLTVLSHELKAPLNAIEGYLRIMKERKAGDDIGAYDQMIDRSLERVKGMRNLIMDLLDLTHIDSGKMKREIKFQDIEPIIRTCMILTARESVAVRREVMQFGVSQIDGGTKLELGSYSQSLNEKQDLKKEQFMCTSMFFIKSRSSARSETV